MEEGRLHAHTARIQWHGFGLRADPEGVAYCEEALRRVLPPDAP